MSNCDHGQVGRGSVDEVSSKGCFNKNAVVRLGVPSRRYALDKEFSGFLDRQEVLTDLLDDMFHVKQ